MSRLFRPILLTLTLSLTTHGEDKSGHLFILSGQSNMTGQLKKGFLETVTEALGEENVTIVQCSRSGRGIRFWVEDYELPEGHHFHGKLKAGNGEEFPRLVKAVKGAGNARKFKSVHFIWMQGESDANRDLGVAYERSFKTLVSRLKQELGVEQMHFVIGRLSNWGLYRDDRAEAWKRMRTAQQKLAEDDPLGAWIDTDDLIGGDEANPPGDLHYSREQSEILGTRFAEAALKQLGVGSTASHPASSPPAGSARSGLASVAPMARFLNGALPARTPSTGTGDRWTRVDAFPGLEKFAQTFGIVSEPNPDPAEGARYLHVLELQGTMQRVKWDGTTKTKTTVLDIRDRVVGHPKLQEGGLRTVVFHPEYNLPGSPNRNYLYAFYSSALPGNNSFRLSRFTRDEKTGLVPADSELIMIQQSVAGSNKPGAHPGGGLVFGLDGMLYVGWGDLEYIFTDPPTSHRDCQRIDRIFQAVILRIDVNRDPEKSDPPTRTLQGNNSAHPHPMPGTSQSCPPDHPFYVTSNFSGRGYFIPKDNYFKVNPPGPGDPSHPGYPHGEALAETVALGIRQPWRLAVDPIDGDIVCFGIGGEATPDIEEADLYVPGGNYGWPYREGTISATPETKLSRPPASFSWSPLYLGTETDAIASNAHGLKGQDAHGCAVGGVIYRGRKYPSLRGKLIWGDNMTGRIWAVDYKGKPVGSGTSTELLQTSAGIMQMCASPDGEEILLVHEKGGRIYKLEDSSEPSPEPPALLSATGAFTDLATLTPSEGLVPYEPASPLWSDRALKKRWIAVPNDGGMAGKFDLPAEKIKFSQDGEWSFPVGTVFIKHFSLPLDEGDPAKLKNLETRFLVHGEDGNWYAVTYKWHSDGSDADLVPDGDTSSFGETFTVSRPEGPDYDQTWSFPTRAQCFECHQEGAGVVLGLNTRQLNHAIHYPSSKLSANQLATMNHLGMFDEPLPAKDLTSYLRSHPLSDETASLEKRIRSYLDSNCAMCHRPGAFAGRATFDTLLTTPLESTGMINGKVYAGDFGLSDPKIIKPGHPESSVLQHRDSSLNPLERMPPVGSAIADEEYLELLRQWILKMGQPTSP